MINVRRAGMVASATAVAVALSACGSPPPSVVTTRTGVLVGDPPKITFYMNRSTTRRLASTLNNWDSTSQATTGLAATIGCGVAGGVEAAGLCAAIAVLGGSLVLDKVQQAARDGGCLAIAMGSVILKLSSYNDDGTYCRS